MKLIHKLPKWQSPQTLGLSTRRLDFETEAFIFQARACLDQFTRSVAYYFKNHCNNILKLKKLLERNYSGDPKAVGIVATIGRHSSLVDGLVSSRGKTADRDVIAHLGKLSFRPLNVILFPSGQISILPHIEGKRVPPADFSSKSQRDIMEDVMKDLSGLIVETYDIVFDGKLGPASSAK